MKNYFKKFSIMLVMSGILAFGTCVSAFAMDDFKEIGTNNLNNTANNSAKIGSALIHPEKGWKRYDDTSSNISYSTDFYVQGGGGFYQEIRHRSLGSSTHTPTIKFSFYGSKLRLFCYIPVTGIQPGQISFDDGNYEKINTLKVPGAIQGIYQGLNYEKTGMDKKLHSVTIQYATGITAFDAIDIDSDGYMLPYTEPVAQSITLNKTTLGVNEGASEQLVATTTPADAQVTWSSSDPLIATVDSNGKVTGVKTGQATITSQITGTNITATCNINVNETSIPSGDQSIMLDKTSAFAQQDTLLKLIATTTPSNAKVIWSSSDPSIATVDSNGLVTILKRNDTAQVTITAQLDGTDKKASCKLTVWNSVLPQSIELNKTSEFVEQGTSIQLHATTMPDNAKIVWSSSDPSVATVDANGLVTVFKREDYSTRVTITAQIDGTDKKASCELVITCNGDWVIPDGYKSISLNRISACVEQGSLIKLSTTTTPSNSKIIWSSSDTSIATVDSDGLVTVPERDNYATVTITAQIDGTDKKASCDLIITFNGDYVLN